MRFDAGLLAEGLQVGRLRAGHRLVPGHPLVPGLIGVRRGRGRRLPGGLLGLGRGDLLFVLHGDRFPRAPTANVDG